MTYVHLNIGSWYKFQPGLLYFLNDSEAQSMRLIVWQTRFGVMATHHCRVWWSGKPHTFYSTRRSSATKYFTQSDVHF